MLSLACCGERRPHLDLRVKFDFRVLQSFPSAMVRHQPLMAYTIFQERPAADRGKRCMQGGWGEKGFDDTMTSSITPESVIALNTPLSPRPRPLSFSIKVDVDQFVEINGQDLPRPKTLNPKP